MTPEHAFLSAILEGPDDGLRLIFADWLEENGQPLWAEFIRLQIKLAGLGSGDPRRPELEKREEELWWSHGSRVVEPDAVCFVEYGAEFTAESRTVI